RRQMRWRALRYGYASIARYFSAHLGIDGGAILAKGDGGGARKISRLHLHGRGLLGPRMDPAAAGLRVLLRQAALRSPERRPCRTDSRPLARRPRLPGQARPLSRKPRRAARRVPVFLAAASGGGDYHLPLPRVALLSRWPVRGSPNPGTDPSLPRS